VKNIDFTVQDLKELMSSMHRFGIGALRVEQGDFRLELESPGLAAAPLAVSQAATEPPAAPGGEPSFSGSVVRSPLVGTFYASPDPAQSPFVKAGDRVKKGDVLFIIESMKLMNEVTSELDGIVTDIFVKNAQTVEYGQPILAIEGGS
jgi:acetyl-CoA carboxylase biotin carboxyl carrier protein